MKPGDFVFVTWLDPLSEDGWVHRDEVNIKPSVIHTVGILVTNTDDMIVVSLNHDTDQDNLSCFMAIPKCIIQNMRVLQ